MSLAKKLAPSAVTLPLVKVMVSASSIWLVARKLPPRYRSPGAKAEYANAPPLKGAAPEG